MPSSTASTTPPTRPTGAAPGTEAYSPYGLAFDLRSLPGAAQGPSAPALGGAAADVPVGPLAVGGLGSMVKGAADATNAAGFVAQANGYAQAGAAQMAGYRDYGAALFKQYCFAAGTPLRTPSGHKAIELFQVGDEILSAPDWNAEAPVEVKVVEEVFSNLARVVNLHVGDQVIRTTAEHPFFVRGKGWTKAGRFSRATVSAAPMAPMPPWGR